MSEEIRFQIRVSDEGDVSYAVAELERIALGFIEEGYFVDLIVRAIVPAED